MRIIVFGTRKWNCYARIYWFFLALRRDFGTDITVVEGGARGADRMARRAAEAVGFSVEEHLPDWGGPDKRGAGHVRNEEMARAGADAAFSFGHGRGTDHMVGMCDLYDIPLRRLHPEWPIER